MRVLIVGAGIGGLTLAALLRRWNIIPDVIDRAPNFDHAGYMLGLYPLGSRILHGLGAFEAFVATSEPMDYYALANGKGEVIHRYDLGVITDRFGPIRQLSRGELLTLLAAAAGHPPVRMGVEIEAIEQHDDEVLARTSDREARRYDLVVGADGIHSAVRRHVFGDSTPFDTGWGGWVWWADHRLVPHDTVTEYWGAGRFLGVYPTKNRIGVVACGPVRDMDPHDRAGRRERILRHFAALEGKAGAILQSLPGDDAELFFWPLADQRAASWVNGRVVLLGDAAAAFLPTAGIGASMAMESAAVLADELSRADAAHLEHPLGFYEARRRKRVEAAQNDSRHMARMMFIESVPLAWGRDQALKFYSLEQLVKQIAKIFEQPI
jgi:2-polyprenyl-6-methoxyphenol hydroxylase-like FAD-dependent oxidoreductase